MATSITGQGIAAYKAPDDALSSESKNAVQNKVIDGELSDVKNAISQKAPLIINSASGDVASFADGADGMQIRKIVGTIVPVQSGTGDPSPDNVRPISGWTGANIEQRGNLFDQHTTYAQYEQQDGSFLTTGLKFTAVQFQIPSRLVGRKLTFSAYIKIPSGSTITNPRVAANVNGTNINGDYVSSADYARSVVTFTPTSTSDYVAITYGTAGSQNMQVKDIQLEVSPVATEYKPYVAITLPINWQSEAGTIYGGTVTLNEDGSADVVSTHLFVTLDGSSDEDVTAGSDGAQARWYPPSAIRSIIRYPSIASTTNSFANYLKVVSQSASWIDNMFSMASNNYVYMRCDTIGALANWRTYLAEHPLQFWFELKQTAYAFYHFDNIGQLYTYLGTNNVWIDTGSITECNYTADTKLYIDGLTAPDEDMIADANIASGKYFVVNNQLYLSTAAIAAGASIVPGTNCTATNLAEALNALNT